MRAIVSVAAAALMALAPVSQAYAGNVTPREIEKILSDQGYAVQQFQSPNMLRVNVGDYAIIIAIDGADADITYRTYLFGVDASELGYQFLNKFNNEVKFGRAYIDQDGDVAIQMDRNSAGGVSAENIESDFEVFLLLISKFLTDLESQTIA